MEKEKDGTTRAGADGTMGHGRWCITTFAHLQMCYCDRVQIMATLACLVSVIQQSSNETVCMWTFPVIYEPSDGPFPSSGGDCMYVVSGEGVACLMTAGHNYLFMLHKLLQSACCLVSRQSPVEMFSITPS